MAPEQAAGRPDLIHRHTDVYGLGAVLYEILTAKPPFSDPDPTVILRKVQEEEPILPRQIWREVPSALEALCLRALSKQPEDRPAAAGELAREIQVWQEAQRQEALDALLESERLYSSLVESVPFNVFRKGRDGQFTFANAMFCRNLNRSSDELLGKTDYDVYPPSLADKYREDDRHVMEQQIVLDTVEVHEKPSGERTYYQVLKMPVYDVHGDVIGIQAVSWDVTSLLKLYFDLESRNPSAD
jgi:PAS domain S-box-containing protein